MPITVGSRWTSTVCTTEVLVVRAGDGVLTCGGTAMVPSGAGSGSPRSTGDGLQLGKRYADETSGLQLLCTRPGSATVAVDGRPVEILGAKPLPASD